MRSAPPGFEAVLAVRKARGRGGDCGGWEGAQRHAHAYLDRLFDG